MILKLFKIVMWIAWIILLSICICNPERLVFKILLTILWIYITWLAVCLSRAPLMHDEYDEHYKKYEK